PVARLTDALIGELVLALMLRKKKRERVERDWFRIETTRLFTSFRWFPIDGLQRAEHVGLAGLVAIGRLVPRHTQLVDEPPPVGIRSQVVVHRLHLHGLDADDALCALIVGFDALANEGEDACQI